MYVKGTYHLTAAFLTEAFVTSSMVINCGRATSFSRGLDFFFGTGESIPALSFQKSYSEDT